MFFRKHPNDEQLKCLKILRDSNFPLDGGGWWVRYPKRALKELSKMAEGSRTSLRIKGNAMIFDEWITTNFGTKFLISIEAEGYPHKIPKAYLIQPRLKKTKHLLRDGSLCLMQSSQYSSSISILQIRNLASAWCFCCEVYSNTGEWPAAED